MDENRVLLMDYRNLAYLKSARVENMLPSFERPLDLRGCTQVPETVLNGPYISPLSSAEEESDFDINVDSDDADLSNSTLPSQTD